MAWASVKPVLSIYILCPASQEVEMRSRGRASGVGIDARVDSCKRKIKDRDPGPRTNNDEPCRSSIFFTERVIFLP